MVSPLPFSIDDQSLYQQIFRSSPEAIVVVNRTGHIVKMNDRITDWLGFSQKELIGKHLLQLPILSLGSKEIIVKNFLKRLAGKEVKEYSVEFLTKTHKVKIGKIRGSLLRDENNRIVADVVMISESTEEYFQEEADKKKTKILEAVNYSAKYFLKSQASQQDFEKVLKTIGESASVSRVVLVINDLMNQKYEWVAPHTKSILRDKNYPNLFSKKTSVVQFSEVIKENKVVKGTVDDFRGNALEFLENFHIQSLVLQPVFVKKKLWAYLGVHDCVNKRKWLEEEVDALTIAAEIIGAAIEKNQVEIQLRETVEYWKHEKELVSKEVQNTQKFKQAVESATDGVLISSIDNKLIFVNPAWERMLGYQFKDVEELSMTDLLKKIAQPEDISMFDEIGKALIKGNSSEKDLVKLKRKDGTELPVRMSIFPVREKGENQFVVAVLEDITRRLEVDRMKNEFISIASHQLNTPLSAMKWFLELLLQGKAGELTPKQLDFVHNISGSNQRMISLVRSLLNVSRIESGRIIIDPRLTSLERVIRQVLEDVNPLLLTRKQKLHFEIDPTLPKIKLDPRLIRHVYMNLLTNASKYSHEEGNITLTVTQKGDQVISHVKDSGYGIPKADQGKIFTKFYRAPNVLRLETDGSGLGLYLVKTIIDSSGGRIWFESEENKGTDFGFSLPLKGVRAKTGEVFLDQNVLSLT